MGIAMREPDAQVAAGKRGDYSDLFDAIGSFYLDHLGGRVYEVRNERDCAIRSQAVGDWLSKPSNVDDAVSAILEFTKSLWRLKGVDGVAYVRVREPKAPTTLVTTIFAPLDLRKRKSNPDVRAAIEAHTRLTAALSSFLPVTLRFANSRSNDVRSAAARLVRRWRGDTRTSLVALLHFVRG